MGSEERYYVLFMVDSCMGDKRNTQDINCGGEKDTTCYSLLTVVWETKKYTRYKNTEFYSWLTVVWETKEIHKI